MTTIICKDGEVWSDSQSTVDSIVYSMNTTKIIKHMGYIICASGIVDQFQAVFSIIKSQKKMNIKEMLKDSKMSDKLTSIMTDDNEYAVMDPTGKIYTIYSGRLIACENDHLCLGSGSTIAESLLMAGISVKKAMKITIKKDIRSGGKIKRKKIK